MFVLVKVPTPVRTSWTSLIEKFSLPSKTILDIYSENVWESTAINLISIFASSTTCFCLKTNQSDLSFTVHKFWKSNVQWNVLHRQENFFHTGIQRESKHLSPTNKSRRGCTFFIPHLSKCKRNDKVAVLTAFF